jgi:predicted RNase H-like HicB family nuclease
VSSIPLSILYETVEDGWVQARIEEMPAVITAARTRPEAREQVLDALHEYLLALRDEPPGTRRIGDREPVAIEITA